MRVCVFSLELSSLPFKFCDKFPENSQRNPCETSSLLHALHAVYSNWPCSKRAGDWVRTYFFLVRIFNIA